MKVEVSPVEEHIGLSILHHRLMDLCYILVIKLIPLTVDHILTVRYVVTTWGERDREADAEAERQRGRNCRKVDKGML